ncbi:DUF397 domain-containing protein [Nocardiopsis mangrovi]|uniref:DUF397 domain-containing protein n=1 Tax=Nocardiopsis mangrovi TaxID=1179818 RepID=A0ABV9DXP6_9ACTN
MSTKDWAKSSFSKGGADNCVECRSHDRAVRMRDTQHQDLGHLEFGAAEWGRFIRGVRADSL